MSLWNSLPENVVKAGSLNTLVLNVDWAKEKIYYIIIIIKFICVLPARLITLSRKSK